MFLGGWAAGQGLTELVNGTWFDWNACPSATDSSYDGCYTGRRPDSLAQDGNTYVFDLQVQWSASETLVVTDGRVKEPPAHQSSDRHPLVWFTTSRGALRGAWDPVNGRYAFSNFGDQLVDLDATPPVWRSTGMGDTCVWGSAWTKHKASTGPNALLMAVADGGVVRTLDDGRSYQRVSEGWAVSPATGVPSHLTISRGRLTPAFAANRTRPP